MLAHSMLVFSWLKLVFQNLTRFDIGSNYFLKEIIHLRRSQSNATNRASFMFMTRYESCVIVNADKRLPI